MFKLRADSPTWAVAESEGGEIAAFVSHNETKAQVVFKNDNDPSVGLASEPVTVSLIGLYDGSQNVCCLRPHNRRGPTGLGIALLWEGKPAGCCSSTASGGLRGVGQPG